MRPGARADPGEPARQASGGGLALPPQRRGGRCLRARAGERHARSDGAHVARITRHQRKDVCHGRAEAERRGHAPCRHRPARSGRSGDQPFDRAILLLGAAGSGAASGATGQRWRGRSCGTTSGPAGRHGHGAAAGCRHGGGRTAPLRERAGSARGGDWFERLGAGARRRCASAFFRGGGGAGRTGIPPSAGLLPRGAAGRTLPRQRHRQLSASRWGQRTGLCRRDRTTGAWPRLRRRCRGATRMSTGEMLCVPMAIAPIAWMPPSA